MSQHRASVSVTLKVNDLPVLQRCLHERPMRVMVFCVTELQGLQDISFPHQSEIKVNNEEVKANLRGLKGKPGSTKPVDITSYLRLKQSNYVNNIEFTYALTTKVKKTRPQQREVSIIINTSKWTYSSLIAMLTYRYRGTIWAYFYAKQSLSMTLYLRSRARGSPRSRSFKKVSRKVPGIPRRKHYTNLSSSLESRK